MAATRDREMEKYRKANPWVLVNVQNSGALCGRYPTVEAAKQAAQSYGDDCLVAVEGHQVLFSAIPQL